VRIQFVSTTVRRRSSQSASLEARRCSRPRKAKAQVQALKQGSVPLLNANLDF